MGRKKFIEKEVEHFKADDLSVDGRAVGRDGDWVVFVKGMVPGDEATVLINRKRRRFYEAEVKELVNESPSRVEARCKHFEHCGGCKWQHLDYESQLKFKQNQVDKAFEKIAHMKAEQQLPILGSRDIYYYRNKVEFSFSNKRWMTPEEIKSKVELTDRNALGYHVPRLFDKVLNIEECHLIDSKADEIRNALREFAKKESLSFYDIRENRGLLRNIFIRNTSTGEWMVNMVLGDDNEKEVKQVMEFLDSSFPDLSSLNYTINLKKNNSIGDLKTICYSGKDHITEQMGKLKFKIRPKSFYQTNSAQAERLYQVAFDFAELKKDELLYDLYTGTGTIALFCAHAVNKVVGVEYVDQAIADAKENAEDNKISNATFFHGDMQKVLNEEFLQKQGKPDVIITDPPRAGMHPDVIKTILKADADRIVYVSCNPATQARDVELLNEKYDLIKSQAVDMFPHTSHIENVVLLKRRK